MDIRGFFPPTAYRWLLVTLLGELSKNYINHNDASSTPRVTRQACMQL